MARKVYVHGITLEHDPVEILNYNPNRVHALIYGDVFNYGGVFAIGDSGQLAKTAPAIQLYSLVFMWEGINPLWAVVPASANIPQTFTILELVDV